MGHRHEYDYCDKTCSLSLSSTYDNTTNDNICNAIAINDGPRWTLRLGPEPNLQSPLFGVSPQRPRQIQIQIQIQI